MDKKWKYYVLPQITHWLLVDDWATKNNYEYECVDNTWFYFTTKEVATKFMKDFNGLWMKEINNDN